MQRHRMLPRARKATLAPVAFARWSLLCCARPPRPGGRPRSLQWPALPVRRGPFPHRLVQLLHASLPADLRSNIAAEARAKIIYERLINLCDDPGVKDALGFLMTREIAHQKSFEKALYAIKVNFPPGKLPGQPEFTNTYFNMSQGEGDLRGPWNQGEQWEFIENREKQAAVDGGDGSASVKLNRKDMALAKTVAARTMSDPASNPTTGAQLGQGSQTA